MAAVTSREELKEYCLRRLGHPVIEINVDDDQVEDRIDDALQFYRQYHYDAVEKVFLKAQVTPSTMVVSGNANVFTSGEILIGQTSGTQTQFLSATDSTNLTCKNTTKDQTFTVGETIRGQTSNVTATVVTFTKGSYDNQYFEVSDAVAGIERVLPFYNKASGINLFDIRYQMIVQDLYNLMSVDMIHYTMVQQHLQLINMTLVGVKPMRFNRHMHKLYIDMDWENDISMGDYVIIDAYRILDPNQYPSVYDDMFLKRYATALIKRQWGTNMKKFQGVQLPGGVLLNGQQIYDEAELELKQIEEEIQSRFELPIDFFVG